MTPAAIPECETAERTATPNAAERIGTSQTITNPSDVHAVQSQVEASAPASAPAITGAESATMGAVADGIAPGGIKVPRHVAKSLFSGTSALGAGVIVERGLGFLANILAARLGGASTFGAYSLAITTAGNISTYAAGGIGATAARFSGKYPHGSPAYSIFARALLIVSLVSAALAVTGLWFGAAPLAHLLAKQSLAPLLRWAALSAAGMILLECARGFFVGQRRLLALLLLSLVVGLGMVALVPLAATHHSPVRMIVSQGIITTAAVVVCLLLARPLGLLPNRSSDSGLHASGMHATAPVISIAPMLREVWSFGMVQLAGLVGMNLAGWWLTTLVARADTTLVQMSFFAIANQMRNIVGLGPSLLTESSYAIMAASDNKQPRTSEQAQNQAAHQTPDHVMALCTYLSTTSALLLSSLGILVIPWMLTLLYGGAYHAAATTTAIGLAIAVVHMGNSPAAARLTIVSIRTTGVINTLWAIFVAAAGTALLLHGGSAAGAMAVYLAGHVLSSALVVTVLLRRKHVPPGMIGVFTFGTLTAVVLAALACVRDRYPALALPLTLAMLALLAGALCALYLLGRKHHWLPSAAVVRQLLLSVRTRLLPTRLFPGSAR